MVETQNIELMELTKNYLQVCINEYSSSDESCCMSLILCTLSCRFDEDKVTGTEDTECLRTVRTDGNKTWTNFYEFRCGSVAL